MKVTSVNVTPTHEGQLRAYVTIVLDDCLVINDMKLIESDNGLFVSMPNRKRKDGTIADIVHPINAQTREMITHAVLMEYQRVDKNSKLSVQKSV